MSYGEFFGYLAVTAAAIVLAVMVGLAIRILTLDTPGPPPPKTRAPYYVVRRGDALSTIADRTGIPVRRLERLNPGIDPLGLMPGERLRLKASVPTAAELERARARRLRPKKPYHVVKRGDTLSGISEKTGVPLFRLFRLNKRLRRGTLVPGQRVRLRR